MSEAGDLISVTEARRLLRISKPRMAELITSGELEAVQNPLDRRGKLVRRSDVEALARRAGRAVED
jgi:excisionase family DNA binding protein